MNSQEKLVILNKAAEKLREGLREIDGAYKDDKDVSYYTWKIGKLISGMHQAICKSLEKQINDEQFKDIVKHLEDGNVG